jgi:coatomer protein complex subunit gamma
LFADDFKIVVIDAIKSLCEKYPAKHRTLMTFLAHMVREEGGYEYKKAIVDAFLSLIRKIDGAKDVGLLHLAEFIEDCEFTYLSTQVRNDTHS